jgi:hypothetical protein
MVDFIPASEDKITEAIDLVKKNEGNHYDVTSLSIITVEGKPSLLTNHACHAGLHQVGSHKINTIVHHIQKVREDRKYKEYEEDKNIFLEWMIGFSPWKGIFRYDFKESLDRNVLVCNTNHPNNLLVGGLISARLLSEFVSRLRVFASLVKEGVTPNSAFFFSHCYISTDKELVVNATSAHTGISPYCNEKTLTHFLKGQPQKLNPTYWDYHRYGDIHHTWWDNDDETYHYGGGVVPAGNGEEILKRVSTSVNSNNPFAKIDKAAIPFNSGIKTLAEILKETYSNV